MEEKRIGFKLAKISKDKGYSSGDSFYYVQYHGNYIYDEDPNHPESHLDGEVRFNDRGYHKNLAENCDFSCENFTFCEAPTISLLQTWFRDVHNIDVSSNVIIIECGGREGKRYYWEIVDSELKLTEDLTPLGYLTYEEALEVGLEEAFKLI